ncbi:hypothetical protein ACROYT_G008749 [Oculina patagonica]
MPPLAQVAYHFTTKTTVLSKLKHSLSISVQISSPVFEAMFYGELAETGDSIELPDCEYESLLEMFRYMYSDEAVLSGSNVMGVLYLTKTEIHALVIRDTLTIEEIELFEAFDLWATKECERQGLAAEGKVKRRVFGEQIIKGIRFPTMKLEDFTGAVLDSDILTKIEISIVKCLGSASSSPVAFSETKRRGLLFTGNVQRCCRFDSVDVSGWYYGGSIDAISLSVDKDIVLHGVCFFGNENKAYSVDLKVNDTLSVLVSKTGQFSSELLQGKNCSYYGFKVMFDKEKVILKKNTKYNIRAKIFGSVSQRGASYVSFVQCSGVTFTFMNNEYSTNATCIYDGQFPELLFSL